MSKHLTIAYIGNFEPEWSTENDVRKAFQYLGHDVICSQEGDQFNPNKATIDQIRDTALQADLVLWTGTWGDAYPLEEVVDILRQCAMKGIPTATLHLDIFFGTGRGGRKWWTEPMFFTRYVFTADGSHEEDWKKMGIDHYWLRPAVRHDATHFGKFREEYACDVAFVGSDGNGYHEDVWPYRKELVDKLEEMCMRNGWTFKNPGGRQNKIDRGEDMNDFYASAKVTVGDSLCLLKEKTNYCSDRVYEATGRGGLLIMPELEFLDDDFGGALTMYPWGNYEVLEELITAFLEVEEDRMLIRETTQEITRKHHTYVNRALELLDKVGL